MFKTTIDNLKLSRAIQARNIEYLKESVLENKIDEATEAGESLFFKESVDDLLEAKQYDSLISDDESVTESVELEKIMQSDHDLSFDEMIGVH